jgi:hypothetical protein
MLKIKNLAYLAVLLIKRLFINQLPAAMFLENHAVTLPLLCRK